MRRSKKVDAGKHNQTRNEKDPQETPLRHDANHERCKQQAAGNRAELLKKLYAADRLFHLAWRQTAHFWEARDHARGVLHNA